MHYGDEISHVSAPSKTGYEFRRWWATDDNQYVTMPGSRRDVRRSVDG